MCCNTWRSRNTKIDKATDEKAGNVLFYIGTIIIGTDPRAYTYLEIYNIIIHFEYNVILTLKKANLGKEIYKTHCCCSCCCYFDINQLTHLSFYIS